MSDTVDYIAAIEALKAQYPNHPEYQDMARAMVDELDGSLHLDADVKVEVVSKLEELRRRIAEYELKNPGFIDKAISDFNSNLVPDWIETGAAGVGAVTGELAQSAGQLYAIGQAAGQTALLEEIGGLFSGAHRINKAEAAEIAFKAIQERAKLESYTPNSGISSGGLSKAWGAVQDFFEAAWLWVRGKGEFSVLFDALQAERNEAASASNAYPEIARGRSSELFESIQEISFTAQMEVDGQTLPVVRRAGPDVAGKLTRINPADKTFTGYPLTEKPENPQLVKITSQEQKEFNATLGQQIINFYSEDYTALKVLATIEVLGAAAMNGKGILGGAASYVGNKTVTGRIVTGAVKGGYNLVAGSGDISPVVAATANTPDAPKAPASTSPPKDSSLITLPSSGGGARTADQQAAMAAAAKGKPTNIPEAPTKAPRVGTVPKVGAATLLVGPLVSSVLAWAKGEGASDVWDSALEATPKNIVTAHNEGRHAEGRLRAIEWTGVGLIYTELQRPWQRHVMTDPRYTDVDPGLIEGAVVAAAGMINSGYRWATGAEAREARRNTVDPLSGQPTTMVPVADPVYLTTPPIDIRPLNEATPLMPVADPLLSQSPEEKVLGAISELLAAGSDYSDLPMRSFIQHVDRIEDTRHHDIIASAIINGFIAENPNMSPSEAADAIVQLMLGTIPPQPTPQQPQDPLLSAASVAMLKAKLAGVAFNDQSLPTRQEACTKVGNVTLEVSNASGGQCKAPTTINGGMSTAETHVGF